VSTGHTNSNNPSFETRNFYLACFLRCSGYELLHYVMTGGARSSSFGIAPRGATT
jgi:hypothetical protein